MTIPELAATMLLLAFGTLAVFRILDEMRLERMWNAMGGRGGIRNVFLPDMVADLPVPARQYILHAIQPGTVLAEKVELKMAGAIKLNESSGWVPFEASQILYGGRGFIWKAQVRLARFVRLSGADSYFKGKGRMRFALFGLVPIVSASGPDVDKSAAGRLLIESVWLPSVLLPQRGVRWEEAHSHRHAKAVVSAGGVTAHLTLTIGDGGELREAVMPRYQGGNRYSFGPVPFGITVEEERRFGGFTIPSKLRAGWWYGTARYHEFFRVELKSAHFY